MKHLILILSLLLTLNIFGQSSNQPNYPIYQYDSINHKMLVTITVEQATTIDNDYDLLELLEKSKNGCDSLTTSYQIVISNLGQVIASQEVKLKDDLILNNKNNEIIDNLREQVKKYIQDGMKCDLLVKDKEDEIGALNKQILKLKVHEAIGYTGLGLFGAAAVTLLIYSVLHH